MGDGRLDAGDVVRGNKGDLLKCQECQTYFRRVTRQQVILIKFPTMRHASAFAVRQGLSDAVTRIVMRVPSSGDIYYS